MVGKHRHKPNTTSRRNCRRKDRRTLETATEKPRTIGQILLHGPANHEEETRLAEFRRKQRAFFEAFLPNSSFADRSVHAAIYQALRDLCMTRGGLYHAIQTQHRERSRDFLKKVGRRAEELRRSGTSSGIPAPRPEPMFITNKLTGFGGYPADSCQICGRFLTTVCYSQIRDRPRVPRTDKICHSCFECIEADERREYQQYRYSTRWEPWEPWGNTPKS